MVATAVTVPALVVMALEAILRRQRRTSNQIIAAETQPPAETPANPPTSIGTNYVLLGESDFRAAKYQEAVGLRHALLDEPNNAGLCYGCSGLVPERVSRPGTLPPLRNLRWGHSQRTNGARWSKTIAAYGNIADYTSELEVLEEAVKQKPNEPLCVFCSASTSAI